MSKSRNVPDVQGSARAPHGGGSGDMMLAAARQERQRAEIQAKLNAMLDTLRFSAAPAMPARSTRPIERLQMISPVPLRREPSAVSPSEAVKRGAPRDTPGALPLVEPSPLSEAALKQSLGMLCAVAEALAPPPATVADATLPTVMDLRRTIAEDLPMEAPEAAAHALSTQAAAPALTQSVPAGDWQEQIGMLSQRLDRLEAASVAAAATLDGLVSSVDDGQKTTFAAAQASAREEAQAVVARDVHPAIAELEEASSRAREEIHGVLTLLGTCLDRVVGHLQRLEGVAGAAVPAQAADATASLPLAELEPIPVLLPAPLAVEPPLPVASAPSVPLPGFGRRSKFAALIDFGFSTRAA